MSHHHRDMMKKKIRYAGIRRLFSHAVQFPVRLHFALGAGKHMSPGDNEVLKIHTSPFSWHISFIRTFKIDVLYTSS